ncbi:hypothetical protein [Amnibacterium setariae]|uniref:Uncharacterized protein n=1 Tax=Amnibacterium setariae TaxID=2306585 RepID=A0A3A1U6K7_9MICO|nr:hypothetical protein [Amnibacterium setariae]RIX31087.1 hypothetical protein D1781_06875 [Amnibacterium setariae]
MTGASSATRRVTHLNANWTPASGGDGSFELLVVTEDERRHSVPTTAAGLTALASVLRDGVVLLWDPDGQVLSIGNLFGEWIPADWSSRSGPASG